MHLNEGELREVPQESFNPEPGELNAVIEQAMKLNGSGKWGKISNTNLTAEFINEKLQMADRELIGSWNWWTGQLDYFNEEDFRQFQVR